MLGGNWAIEGRREDGWLAGLLTFLMGFCFWYLLGCGVLFLFTTFFGITKPYISWGNVWSFVLRFFAGMIAWTVILEIIEFLSRKVEGYLRKRKAKLEISECVTYLKNRLPVPVVETESREEFIAWVRITYDSGHADFFEAFLEKLSDSEVNQLGGFDAILFGIICFLNKGNIEACAKLARVRTNS